MQTSSDTYNDSTKITEMWKRDFKMPAKTFSSRKASTEKEISTRSKFVSGKKEVEHVKSIKKPKKSLNKFINKKPNFLKDTTGSKTKKKFGTEKAQRIRTTSRENNIRSNQNLQKNLEKKEKEANLDDLIQLADDFWDNVPLNESQKSKSKPSIKKVRVPVSERQTTSSRMKNRINRPQDQKQDNKYFHNKFKSKLKPVASSRASSSNRKRTVPKRVISSTREIGIKTPTIR